ncbi:phosphatidic acid phosphatase type 2/haloperoxidase [Mrakia frigida]|uniref:phosphatase PAP2 family protein n=1 Tax=Mrakia frigida TaxID=29902 RepID=UPI003FCC220A
MVFGRKNKETLPSTANSVAPSEAGTGRTVNADQTTAAPTRGKGGLGGHEKFSFGQWIRLWGPDLITMALMGALGLGLYESPPAPSRSFPIYFEDGQIVYPEYAYPMRKEVVPILLAAALAFLVPFVFIALFQIRHKSIHMLTATTMALVQSLITAAVFQVFLKTLIGGFRPHFLEVCKPNILPGDVPKGNGFGNIMYQRDVCTGDEKEINDSLESFPSGHSTAAAAGFVFLSLYINAQMKVMSDYRPAYWKQIFFFAPLLGVVLIGGALTIDKFHHWWDVAAGITIGTATAFVSYRQCFASVWDFRFNHILLSKRTSLFLHHPAGGTFARFPYSLNSTAPDLALESNGSTGGLINEKNEQHQHQQSSTVGRGYDAPFSREGGWGHGVGDSGAPGDALRSGERALGAGAGGLAGGVGSGLTNGGGHGIGHQHHGVGGAQRQEASGHHHGLGGARQEELEVQRGAGVV